MISAVIVLVASGLGTVFVITWLIKPHLRAGIEAPKYRFQDRVRRYDRQCRTEGDHR